MLSLIRNSSYHRIPVEGIKKWKQWRPNIDPSHQYIEIESMDKSVELLRDIGQRFHAFLVNKEGKIVYYQDTFNIKLLIIELIKSVSVPE